MEHKVNMIDWKLVLITILMLWVWVSLDSKTVNNYYDIETAIIVDSTFDLDTAVLMGDTLYDSTYSWIGYITGITTLLILSGYP